MPTPADAPTLDAPQLDLAGLLEATAKTYDGEAAWADQSPVARKHYTAYAKMLRDHTSSLPALLEASRKHDALRAAVVEISERSSYPIDPRDAFEEALSRAHAAARSSGETTPDQPNAVPTQVMTNE